MSPLFLRVLQLLFLILLQAALLFISAGTLHWPSGQLYIGLYLLMIGSASSFMLPHGKEVLSERSKGAKGAKTWDFWLTRLIMLTSLGLLVLAGLDERWNWTPPLPLWIRLLGVFLFIAGFALVLWAMYVNKFFSQVVRIQTERGHVAVTKGPYRIVRHPGYLGMIASMLGSVFILDSLYGLICFVLYLIVIVVRTALEDATLRDELPGYSEYTLHTKYRLIPGIW